MKHLKIIFRTILPLLLTLFPGVTTPLHAQDLKTDSIQIDPMDSVEISLLTCQPHDEIYSLYGHTAIRYRDQRDKERIDVAFNYGVFDFKKPHFVLRFVFGLTDYELGCYPYDLFLGEYRHFGSLVTEQVLNLTAEEKVKMRQALSENLLPGNSVYRYNYFDNNCTTKARDIIEKCINGKVEYSERELFTPTYREMVHEMTAKYPWATFGNDFLLGVNADKETGIRQQEFLPHNLMYDFDHAQIYENGTYRPMVKERRVAVPAGVQIVQEGFPLTPQICGIILSLIGLVIFAIEWKKKHSFLVWDLLLMAVTGILGIILTLMIFSQHPTVSLNLQIILFNPLPWFYLWSVIKGHKTYYWHMTVILAIAFLAGGFIQDYPDGIWSLALCLLLQAYIHIKRVF